MNEHTIPLGELLAKYGTNLEKGLTEEKAAEYLARDGPNALTRPSRFDNDPDLWKSVEEMMPPTAIVTRNGEKKTIPATELVVGDLVDIKVGDRIPADMRIFQQDGLKVDISGMTGESEPQSRSPECTSDNPLETKNLVFFTTKAVSGTGRGIVFNTGERMVMASFVKLISRLDGEPILDYGP